MFSKMPIVAVLSFNLAIAHLTFAGTIHQILSEQEKEVELKITNSQPNYPLNIRYKVCSEKHCYADGSIKNLSSDIEQFIYINQIPTDLSVTVDIYKMNVRNRTVFNDPCRVKLSSKHKVADISVGFLGDPATHGSFTCQINTAKPEKEKN